MKPKSDDFSRALQSLIRATSAVEIRLHEIKEFEKQWKNIFAKLSGEFGNDVKINISNQLLLHTFRYDKFHVVCDDLMSLIENEYQSEFSVCKSASSNIAVQPIKEYIDDERTKPYGELITIDAKTSTVIESDAESERRLFEPIIAQERRNAHLVDYRLLFGDGVNDDERWKFLKAKLINLKDKIRGLRNLFSHRNMRSVQERYSEQWDDLEIEKVESWFYEFFVIVQKIKLLNDGTYYRGMVTAFPMSVADQIDLILFGTIDRCTELFIGQYPGKTYSSARREFYKSKQFVSLIVAKKIEESV